jgi:hypothetical protein
MVKIETSPPKVKRPRKVKQEEKKEQSVKEKSEKSVSQKEKIVMKEEVSTERRKNRQGSTSKSSEEDDDDDDNETEEEESTSNNEDDAGSAGDSSTDDKPDKIQLGARERKMLREIENMRPENDTNGKKKKKKVSKKQGEVEEVEQSDQEEKERREKEEKSRLQSLALLSFSAFKLVELAEIIVSTSTKYDLTGLAGDLQGSKEFREILDEVLVDMTPDFIEELLTNPYVKLVICGGSIAMGRYNYNTKQAGKKGQENQNRDDTSPPEAFVRESLVVDGDESTIPKM